MRVVIPCYRAVILKVLIWMWYMEFAFTLRYTFASVTCINVPRFTIILYSKSFLQGKLIPYAQKLICGTIKGDLNEREVLRSWITDVRKAHLWTYSYTINLQCSSDKPTSHVFLTTKRPNWTKNYVVNDREWKRERERERVRKRVRERKKKKKEKERFSIILTTDGRNDLFMLWFFFVGEAMQGIASLYWQW